MVRARHPLRRAARRGALIPLVAFGLMVLLGVLAFALDGGMLLSERRRAQAVADAAALAAAINLYQNYGTDQGLDPKGTARQSALAYAAANGYSNNGSQSTVTVNIPPKSGDHMGTGGYAEVIVQFNQPRYFSAVFGSGAIPVGARAVASGLSAAPNNVGLLLLDPSASPSLSGSGSADLDVKSGNVIIDSSSSRAADLSGSASVTAPEIDITGHGPGYTTSGAAQFNTTPTGGNIKTGKVATADPLAKLPPPDPKTLTVQSSQALQIHGQVTLQPGIYKGGISLSGNSSVTFQPGIYYLEGGGLSASGSSSMTGNGVMFYNDASGGTFSFSGGGSLSLTPPTSGPYQGITIYQDRANSSPVALSGNSSFQLVGTIYTPAALVTLSGSSGMNAGSQIIADRMTISGSGNVTVDWGNSPRPTAKDIRLVE